MRFLPDGWRGLRRIWHRAPEREVDAEVAFHLEERTAELLARGMTADRARAQAEAEFGDVSVVRSGLVAIDRRLARRRGVRERWEWLGQDVRYVWRSLRRSPGFVATVVFTLALGLGANIAVFSILDRLFFATPPGIGAAFHPRRLAALAPAGLRSAPASVTVQTVFAWPQIRAIAAVPQLVVGGYRTDGAAVGRGDLARTMSVTAVAGDYFGTLGVHPQRGRFFSAAELRVEQPDYLAVLGDRTWRDAFGARPDIVGQSVQIDGHDYTIIGVAATGFHGADNDAADLWVPMNALHVMDGQWYEGTHSFWIKAVVGSRTDMPDARLAALATAALRHDGIVFDTAARARVEPLAGADNEFDSREISIAARLAGVAAILLLIACANIANLLLARGMQRRRELGVRIALGVARSRLVRLLLVESLSVAALGTAVAIVVAYRGADVLRRMLLPDIHWGDATVNGAVLLFSVGAAAVVGLLAGIVPAWQLSRPDVGGLLRERNGAPAERRRARSALLLVQTALSVVLLAAAGFFVRSLVRVQHADTGYDVDRLVQVDLDVNQAHQAAHEGVASRLPVIAAELAGLPGVGRAAVADMVPMWGIHFERWYASGHDTTSMFGPDGPYASFVGPGFFETVGMRVLRGDGFSDGVRGAAGVVVNAFMARRVWPGRDPLAQCVRIGSATAPCRPVLGVVSDAHAEGLMDEPPSMHFYLPAADTGGVWHAGVILVRAGPGMTETVSAMVARRLAGEFGSWAEVRVHPLADNFARELHPWRVATALFVVAGALSIVVAMIGIYGTVAYSMSQRTREIGVRVALGAAAGGVIRLVVREGVGLVAIGVGVGIGLTLALGRLIDSMLYHTSPHDPLVLATVSVTLLLVAALACVIPAWRALRVDPVVALRAD